jgi:heat shock protein HslJ
MNPGRFTVLCLTVLVTGFGCSSQHASRSVPASHSTAATWRTAHAADVAGKGYVLTDATVAGSRKVIVAGQVPSLSFGADGSFAADDGCNGSGPYSFASGVVTESNAVSGGVGCGGPVLVQEKWFNQVLSSRPTVSISGNRLALTSGGARLIFAQ